jgi:microcystin-dependent protein
MDPFLGQIMAVAFAQAPKNWALCNGQLLPIARSQALYSLIGTSFGGDGITTFALPDLRGRTISGVDMSVGAVGGTENVTLLLQELPVHNHTFSAGTDVAPTGRAALRSNANSFGATAAGTQIYANPTALTLLDGNVALVGASQPHPNMQPYTTVNFIISLTGIYPSWA